MVAAANNPAPCIGRSINYLWAELCAKSIHLRTWLKQNHKTLMSLLAVLGLQ